MVRELGRDGRLVDGVAPSDLALQKLHLPLHIVVGLTDLALNQTHGRLLVDYGIGALVNCANRHVGQTLRRCGAQPNVAEFA